ncbi:helix-turn-helix domain-containing protein [Escherichia coli]
MKRLQAFKFQLRPGGQQEREMRRFAGACRFVFNRALARQNERIMRPVINTSLTGKWLPGWLSGKMPLKRNGLKILPHSHCNSH